MPILIADPVLDDGGPPPEPIPSWWMLLTRTQRVNIATRLALKGLNTTAWPR